MLKRIGSNTWTQQVAVAIAYALVFALLRQVSFSHWFVFAGLRLSALLLVPYRYWPGLLLGEMGPLACTAIENSGKFGWLWGASLVVPPMLFVMPVVRWCRERRRIFPTSATTDINLLLLCTLAASVIWTAVNMATLLLMRLPPGTTLPGWEEIIGIYFVGSFLGILTLTPLVLMVREQLLRGGTHQLWSRLARSRLMMDAACLLVPSLALLVWLASSAMGAASQEARIAMFVPVVWLALRHGWHGAAVGGTAASIAVVLTMPRHFDPDTLHAQVFIAFAISTMMLLGGRIAALDEHQRREKSDARLALALAQRNAHLDEIQLRQTSYALEQVSGAIQASYMQMLGRLRSLMPGADERTYYHQAAVAQHQMRRLADSLYPLSWQERGLQAILREGSMQRALDEAGITYCCDIQGSGLDGLSAGIQLTLYRLASEAIALACAKRNASGIRLRLRNGSFGGRRWAVLCVDSRVDYERVGRVRWDDLLPVLGGSGLGLSGLKDRAMVFGGKVRVRSLPQGSRISLIVFDLPAE